MIRNWSKPCVAAIVGIALLSPSAMARADTSQLLCLNVKERPGGDGDWGVACYDRSWAYASIQVHPTDEQDILDIHITDHGGCADGSHMECVVSNDVTTGFCLPEGSYYGLEGGGFASVLWLMCACYTPEEPCADVL